MRKLTLLSFLVLGYSLSVTAAPITYTISGMGSGEEFHFFPDNESFFSNQSFSFTLMADTTSITSLGGAYVLGDPTFFTLGGVKGTVLGLGMALLSYGNGTIGLLNNTGPGGGALFYNTTINMSSPNFIGYGLASSISPTSVSSVLDPEDRVIEADLISSTAEDAIFTSVSDVTFSASTNSSAAPEPSAIVLIGSGLLALSLFHWKWRA